MPRKALNICFFLLFVFGAVTLSSSVQAQQWKPYEIEHTDSLKPDGKSSLVITTIKISNPAPKNIRLGYQIELPKGWKMLDVESIDYTQSAPFDIHPNEKFLIPVTLLRSARAEAGWSDIKIYVFSPFQDTQCHKIKIFTPADYSFAARVESQVFDVSDGRVLKMPVYIRNKGNVAETYVIKWESQGHNNEYFGPTNKQYVRLEAGKDTTIYQTIRFRNYQMKRLTREEISVAVSDGRKTVSGAHSIVNTTHGFRQHRSAYSFLPITLEGGMMSVGDRLVYYGSGYTNININRYSSLGLSYRSRQMGDIFNDFQQDVFNIHYKYKGFQANLGSVQPLAAGFTVVGQGAHISYAGKGFSVAFAGIKHSEKLKTYKNDNYSGLIKYNLSKNTSMEHTLVYNEDIINKANSYLFANGFQTSIGKKIQLGLRAGVGKEDPAHAAFNADSAWGYQGGYNVAFKTKDVLITSNSLVISDKYPGLQRGLKNHTHGITVNLSKKSFVGLQYASTFQERNFYRDSFFASDMLTYNVERFGINAGYKTKGLNITVNLGQMKYGGMAMTYNMDRYTSFDLFMSYSKGGSILSYRSMNGFRRDQGHNIFLTANNISFTNRNITVNGVYTRTPRTIVEGEDASFLETVNANVNWNYSLFKRRLTGDVRYNVSKTLYSQAFNMGAGLNLNYYNPGSNLTVRVGGFIPFSNEDVVPIENRKVLTVSMTKQLNVPVIFKRKYYDLSVQLYHDENDNGSMDPGERALPFGEVLINNNPFVTDAEGTVTYRNVDKGIYKVDMLHTKAGDLVPSNGPIQFFEVAKSQLVQVPLRKGRIISGNISVQLDSASVLSMQVERLKIIVTDTGGNAYHALSDANGNFKLSVPRGLYTVSLNAEAFEGTSFKPQKMVFEADLREKESETIDFLIIQSKRKVRYLNKK